MTTSTLPSMTQPDIRLFGQVDESMLSEFFRQQAQAAADKAVVFEISTAGGDAEIGRRIAEELRRWQKEGRDVFFLGTTYVFSAGITIMSSVPPDRRFLTAHTELLIHERKRLEHDDFSQFVAGTRLTADEFEKKVKDTAWYLTAAEAEEFGLVAGVV